MKTTTLAFSAATLLVTACLPAGAQQTTGAPGSPSATTTIDGKYLPPPPAPFGGTINLDAKDSKPYWPPTVVPPKRAPNVLLIMTDDQGYGVSGTFGGVIPTPSMDRIANAGLRYSQRGDWGGFSGSIFTDSGGGIAFNLYTDPKEDVSIGVRSHSNVGPGPRCGCLLHEGADQVSTAVQGRLPFQQSACLRPSSKDAGIA
jgi:hypothetical protein